MHKLFRPLPFLLVAVVGLALMQPIAVSATALPVTSSDEMITVSQAGRGPQPGPIVRQAFDILLDRFVLPKKTGDILNGGLDAAHYYLESKYVSDPLESRPAFTGNRNEDWRLFLPAYERVATALGDKGSREILDRVIVDGMAKSLKEAHTYYMPPEIFRAQMAELQNQNRFVGIGVTMSQDLIIMDVFEGSPAESAGFQPGDQIVSVNGESVEGLTATDVSAKVRGEVDTQVTVGVKRKNVSEPIVKTMTRATISLEWLRAKILDGNIGYLQIRAFAVPDALPLFNQAMDRFAEANVKALIIDLRNNPGGSVATGEEIASRLIPPNKPIYREQDRRGQRVSMTEGGYWNRDIPMAVLTNAGSGSMSEILAAALQENGLAKIIGTKTAGAVAAGIPYPLADGSGLLVTVEVITAPSGKVINEVGLEPDQVVELDEAQFRAGKDNQLEAALNYAREQIALRGNR